MVRLLVPLVLLVVVLAATLPAARLPEPDPGIARYLPAGDPVSIMIDTSDGRPWQANQGLREPLAGAAELSAPLRRAIGTTTEADGSWLMVDAIRPDQDGRVLRLGYQLTDRIVLRAAEDSAGWAVFRPGLPLLSAELIDGGTLRWDGTVTARSATGAGSADDPAPRPAAAVISARPSETLPSCLTVSAELTLDRTPAMLGATWCTGADAGWAGALAPSHALERSPGAAPEHRPELTLDPAKPPRLDAARFARVRLLGRLAGRWQEQPARTASRLASAGSTLVVADVDGTVSGWTPTGDATAEESYYGLRWRVRPGGSVRGLATIGDVTVVGTTARTVSGYASDGWRLWQRSLEDAVVDVAAVGDRVLTTDASGELRLLDGRTGAVRWTVDGGDLPWSPVVGPAGRTIAYLDGDTVHVLDAGSGRESWTAAVDEDSAELALADDLVVIKVGNWLIARSAADGRTVWTSEVAAGALLAGGVDEILIFGEESTRALDLTGRERWTTGAASSARRVGPAVALTMPDGIEVRRPNGSSTRWPYPDGFAEPDPALVVTPSGLVAVQRGPGGDVWWEYR
ncbi:PQQ-binding-like beta-propeller repeat protein [Microlunatus speluncae]|uniref:outer membrane protein assembly factor BamB family protein n=1 Tax=Microlunatus speluncae TaxID=2594267 RepID=UPI0013754F27|nr:PQQ-binding-like beta-propeller repeat protein [Microlunatus speluncae]